MTKEIKIGDMVFKEGQIIRSRTINQEHMVIADFYIIEKICPKIVKTRYYTWGSIKLPAYMTRNIQHLQHNFLTLYIPASKMDMDNHVYQYKEYLEHLHSIK